MEDYITFERYARSLGYLGSYLEEYISDLKSLHENLEIEVEGGLFYAKGFSDNKITDKIYFFREGYIELVDIDSEEGKIIKGLTIEKITYGKIERSRLTLISNEEVELSIKLKNAEEITFNNKKDSQERYSRNLGSKIIEIYNRINE